VDIISKGAYTITSKVFISTFSYYDEKHFGNPTPEGINAGNTLKALPQKPLST